MRATVILSVAVGVFVFLSSCNAAILHPKTGPGTEYPCGLHGVECANHSCCDDHFECGAAGTSCPAGLCCYIGDNWPVGMSPTGAGSTRPQVEQHK